MSSEYLFTRTCKFYVKKKVIFSSRPVGTNRRKGETATGESAPPPPQRATDVRHPDLPIVERESLKTKLAGVD